jgi:integrase
VIAEELCTLKFGKLGPEIVLAPSGASVRQVWEAYERLTTRIETDTILWLCNKYLSSPAFAALLPATKVDYLACHQQVISKRSDEGDVLGEIPLRNITPGVLLKYRDARAQKARVRANRELTYLSIVFSWGYERDMVETNPAKGVKRLPEAPRTRYIEDWEYEAVYRQAVARPKIAYLAPAMELAYLMRLRRVEVLALQRSDCTPEGVRARRRKGSREQIVGWSERLRAATASTPSTIASVYVLHDQRGQPITKAAFAPAWNRLMNECLASGHLIERFVFHDLKAKEVTDFDGNKQEAAGHRTARMADVYDRKIHHIKPTT